MPSMNGLFKIDDSLQNKISYYHIVLLMASLPFNMFYSHLILISYALHTLIHLNKKQIKPVLSLQNLVLTSVFFITMLSTVYTINRPAAFKEWGEHITILIIPVLFCLNPFDLKKYRPRLLLWFALVCTATIFYLYLSAIITIKHYNLPLSTLFSKSFTNHNFSEPIGMHATFFSMQLAIALIFLLAETITSASRYKQFCYLCCCGVLTAGLVQLSSKSVIIALVIIINIALPWFLLSGKKRRLFITATASFTALILIAILNSGTLRERFVTDLKDDLSPGKKLETVDTRLQRWGVAAELIKKSPVIGYGAGSEVDLLHESFFKNKLYSSFLNRLNAHNQYLSFLIKSGIVGLLLYLGTLFWGFKIALAKKDLLLLSFITLIAVVSMSESFFDVDKGVCFYAIFFSYFIYSQSAAETILEPLKRHKYLSERATKQLVTSS
jgi:O-antigen ligase